MLRTERRAVSVSACLCLMIAACDNSVPADAAAPAAVGGVASGATAGGPPTTVATPNGSAGRGTTTPTAAGPAGSNGTIGAVGAAAGSGVSAGSAGAVSAGAAGAAATGAAGAVAAGAGGSGASAGSGGAPEGDDFGLPGFPDLGDGSGTPPPTSDPAMASSGMCQDLICFDVFDCVLWHPDEAAVCNFSDCVDFVCK